LIEYSGLKIFWLGHDCFRVEGSKVVYTDPFRIKGGRPADILLITHSHFDHLSPEDIRKISSRETVAVAPESCLRELRKIQLRDVKNIAPGESVEVSGVKVEAVPAYNVDKFRSPGVVFHPKEELYVGYIFTLDGVRFYHAGDTDPVSEMEGLNVDVAFIPVSGTYVMTAEEAAKAVGKIKPKLAIPMHYGTIVGDVRDAERFRRLATCRVQIAEKE